MKIILLFIIFCIVSLFGFLKAEGLKRRTKFLTDAENALLNFENAISWSAMPLSEALSLSDFKLFCKGAALLEGYGTDGFLKEVCEECFEDEEKKILKNFVKGLCAEDKEGQIKNARLCRQNIEALKITAQKKEASLCKVYSATGVLCAFAIVIVCA